MANDTDRLEREAAFHDHAFEHGDRHDADRFYTVTRASSAHYHRLIGRVNAGDRVLEYGCGQGSAAFELARRGAQVTGIDISNVGVEQATQIAASENLVSAEFVVMNAERLRFGDASFDLVCGSAILHHLDLLRAFSEVARVLKDDGEAVFLEPLGHNPLINAYRRRTPHLRTADERPLRSGDLDVARARFRTVDLTFFHMLGLGALALRRTRLFAPALAALDTADSALFSVLPPARKLAWIVVIHCRGPVRSRG